MAIINRTNDISEQKELVTITAGAVATGAELATKVIERAQVITDCKVGGLGLSGTPHVVLNVSRFVAGTGGSTFSVGSTFAVPAFGASGYGSYSLPAAGSTLLNLQKGDVVSVKVGGSNAAFNGLAVDIVVQNIQDIKTWY